MQLKRITTGRLYLIPFTIGICEATLNHNYTVLTDMGITLGTGWPDEDTLDTLPRIINNLRLVTEPTGFESWMIIEKETNAIIGDAGFKGRPDWRGDIDLGYGIISSARRRGYATEAAQGLIGWAFKQTGLKRITARCEASNAGSIKVIQALGFNNTGIREGLLHWELLPAGL